MSNTLPHQELQGQSAHLSAVSPTMRPMPEFRDEMIRARVLKAVAAAIDPDDTSDAGIARAYRVSRALLDAVHEHGWTMRRDHTWVANARGYGWVCNCGAELRAKQDGGRVTIEPATSRGKCTPPR